MSWPAHEPAAGLNDVIAGRAFHRDCGGSVSKGWLTYDCPRCSRRWPERVIRGFTVEDLGHRFYVRPLPSWTTYVLVWDRDGVSGQYHTRLVPIYEAECKERVAF